MILNLTEAEYPGDEVVAPDSEDSQVLFEALGDISRVDEAALIISGYEPRTVIVDVSDDYFVHLSRELENCELILGVNYECA